MKTTALVARAQTGDAQALAQLLKQCDAYLHRHLAGNTGALIRSRLDSGDVVQEILLEVIRSLPRYRRRHPSSFWGWIRAVMHHKIAHLGRSLARDPRAVTGSVEDEPARTPDPLLLSARRERREIFFDALGRLPDEYRDALVLRIGMGKSYREIGRLMRCTPGAARKAFGRALDALRALLGARFHPGDLGTDG